MSELFSDKDREDESDESDESDEDRLSLLKCNIITYYK
jgi:hypothetical protein